MPAGVKITDLPAAATIVGTEQVEVVQSGVSKNVTATGLMAPHTALTGTAAHGLGTLSTQAASAVAITGGTITGITDLAIADGGTGSSTAAGARTALGSTTVGDAVFIAATAAAARTAIGAVIGADVQAYDASLASLSATGTAADKVAYTTGVDTWAETPLTAAGRALIDDASAADQRTTLGSTTVGDAVFIAATAAAARTAIGTVIGTDVQSYDATLNSLASLGTAADKLAYTTAADTWAETALTAAGRALLDDATSSAQLTTLGTTAFNTFVSADQTITLAGALTLAHGLGAAPRMTFVSLVCQTAELGYSVGDVVQQEGDAASCVPNATNLNIRYKNLALGVIHKTTGVLTSATAANWKARFIAIK
jgi:hypothetical protein